MIQYLPTVDLKHYLIHYQFLFYTNFNENLPLFIGNCAGLKGLTGLYMEVSMDCVLLLTTLADGRHKSPVTKGFEITFVV